MVRKYIITAVPQLANLPRTKKGVQRGLAVEEHIQGMKGEYEAQRRVYALALQIKEAPMASQDVGHHGADIDAQYAKCVLIHSFRYTEERDVESSEFN